METAFISVINRSEKTITYLVQCWWYCYLVPEWERVVTLPSHYSRRRVKKYIMKNLPGYFSSVVGTENRVLPVTEATRDLHPVKGFEGLFSETGALTGQLYSNLRGLWYKKITGLPPMIDYMIQEGKDKGLILWVVPGNLPGSVHVHAPLGEAHINGDFDKDKMVTVQVRADLGSDGFTYDQVEVPGSMLYWATRNAA